MSFHRGPFTQRGRGVGNVLGSLFKGVIPAERICENSGRAVNKSSKTTHVNNENEEQLTSRKRKAISVKQINPKVKKGEVLKKSKISTQAKTESKNVGKKTDKKMSSLDKRKKYGDIFEWEKSDSSSNVSTNESNVSTSEEN
jgi:hypothetical protein